MRAGSSPGLTIRTFGSRSGGVGAVRGAARAAARRKALTVMTDILPRRGDLDVRDHRLAGARLEVEMDMPAACHGLDDLVDGDGLAAGGREDVEGRQGHRAVHRDVEDALAGLAGGRFYEAQAHVVTAVRHRDIVAEGAFAVTGIELRVVGARRRLDRALEVAAFAAAEKGIRAVARAVARH